MVIFWVLCSVNILIVMFLVIMLVCSLRRKKKYGFKKTVSIPDEECPMCLQKHIVTRLPLASSFSGWKVGPKYTYRKKIGMNILYCAPIYTDICMNCGNVIRTYIDVPKQADWIHGASPFSKK